MSHASDPQRNRPKTSRRNICLQVKILWEKNYYLGGFSFLGKQQKMSQVPGPCHRHENPRGSSGLLVLAWHCPAAAANWGKELANKQLILSNSAFQLSKFLKIWQPICYCSCSVITLVTPLNAKIQEIHKYVQGQQDQDPQQVFKILKFKNFKVQLEKGIRRILQIKLPKCTIFWEDL